jgi:FkbM family methyltransferase
MVLIHFLDDDEYIGERCRRGLEWDPWLHDIMRLYHVPGTDIVDVGGNIGCTALLFSDYGPVHVFEPVPHLCDVLDRNIQSNVTKNPITLYRHGLFSYEKITDVYTPKRRNNGKINYGGYSILCSSAHEEESHIQINLKRLDDVYNGNASIMKIDVEGVERDVLQGSVKLLTERHPSIIIEIFGDMNEFIQFLEPYGYCAIQSLPESNFLFLHQSLVQQNL